MNQEQIEELLETLSSIADSMRIMAEVSNESFCINKHTVAQTMEMNDLIIKRLEG